MKHVIITLFGVFIVLNLGGCSHTTAPQPELTIRVTADCIGMTSDIQIWLDDAQIGVVQPGESIKKTVSEGYHTIFAKSANETWAPITDYVSGTFLQTLECGAGTPTGNYDTRFFMDANCAGSFTSADLYIDKNYSGTVTPGGSGFTLTLAAGDHSVVSNWSDGSTTAGIVTVPATNGYKLYCH